MVYLAIHESMNGWFFVYLDDHPGFNGQSSAPHLVGRSKYLRWPVETLGNDRSREAEKKNAMKTTPPKTNMDTQNSYI